MGTADDDEGTGKEVEQETVLDMEYSVRTHVKGQYPNEAAGLKCGKEGFVDGDGSGFKAAPGDPIGGDDPTSARTQKAQKKGFLADEDHINGCHSTSASMKPYSEKACSATKDSLIREDSLPSASLGKASKEACIGPRRFVSSTDLLNFFNQLLNGWPLNLDINKYEHMMLEDLLKKGHPKFSEKIGTGIQAFQVRINKEFDSRCFFVVRKDGSMNDFSYRKCVDNILSLPKNLKSKFRKDRSQKDCSTRKNGNAHVVGREGKHNGNGRLNLCSREYVNEGKGNSSRHKRSKCSE